MKRRTRPLVFAAIALAFVLSTSTMAWAHGGSGGDPGWGWLDAPGIEQGAPWSGVHP
ncbi:hypothetical protein [Anaerosoma tenue]|uniref:hypothetical protein n=1 Tax=Anaerosoma tenue TaxID=2933588 RepID=UPI002260861D|nr:hypothetical protein [Anaerosoma tenue]MCK8115773.1 hypothetical protein [Anaerosoma tenue]